MLNYSYVCDVCGLRFELKRSKQDCDEPATCPRCRTPFGKRELSTAEQRRHLRRELLPRKFMGCG